jgi:hypothetical protein
VGVVGRVVPGAAATGVVADVDADAGACGGVGI